MALYLVKALDGEDIAVDIQNNLKAHCDATIILSIDELSNRFNIDERCVVAVIVTPLMLKSLKNSTNTSLASTIDTAGQSIFLYKGCESSDVSDTTELVKGKCKTNTVEVEHFELINEEHHDTAEIKLRKMIRKTKNETVLRPSARKFITEPETVTEGTADIKIILLEDDKNYTQLKVHIPSVSSELSPKKLRDGVWTLKIPDLKAGEHTINVFGDDTDLGTARLQSETKLKSLLTLLPAVVRDFPVQLLCELFNLDGTDFDYELLDFISDQTESCVFFQCLDRILEKGGEKQNCFHFCAKYNLPKTCKRILEIKYGPEMKEAVDVRGKSPSDIAEEMGSAGVKHMFVKEDYGFTGGMRKLPSPLAKSSSFDEPDTPQQRLRKISTVSFDGKREAPISEIKPTAGQSTLQRAKSEEVLKLSTRRRTSSRSAPESLRRDSGNGSAGSRETKSSDEGIQRRVSRGRLASEGEHNTQTILIEKLTIPEATNQPIKYQRGEREYAMIPETQKFQKGEREYAVIPERHTLLRGERDYAEIPEPQVSGQPQVSFRPKNKVYNEPWEDDDLINGALQGSFRERRHDSTKL